MDFFFGPIQIVLSRQAGWFRLFGYGLHWTCGEPLFAERNGMWPVLFRIGKWRFKYLKRSHF